MWLTNHLLDSCIFTAKGDGVLHNTSSLSGCGLGTWSRAQAVTASSYPILSPALLWSVAPAAHLRGIHIIHGACLHLLFEFKHSHLKFPHLDASEALPAF